MYCENCGSNIGNSSKCSFCGYDREATDKEFKVIKEKKERKRSLRLTLYVGFRMFCCVFLSIICVSNLSMALASSSFFAGLLILIIIFAVADATISVFLLFYKKWAFYTIIVESIVAYVLQLFMNPFAFISVIISAGISIAFLYLIVNKDWHKFQ